MLLAVDLLSIFVKLTQLLYGICYCCCCTPMILVLRNGNSFLFLVLSKGLESLEIIEKAVRLKYDINTKNSQNNTNVVHAGQTK